MINFRLLKLLASTKSSNSVKIAPQVRQLRRKNASEFLVQEAFPFSMGHLDPINYSLTYAVVCQLITPN